MDQLNNKGRLLVAIESMNLKYKVHGFSLQQIGVAHKISEQDLLTTTSARVGIENEFMKA